jgi:branched-chain amino acid transport system ATP-binding protein
MNEMLQQNGGSADVQSVSTALLPHASTLQSTISNPQSAILALSSVSAGYRDRPVLHDVSFTVRTGERLVMIGPNGCGKTTLLKVIAGALRSETGQVEFGGANLSRMAAHMRIKKGIGYLMQTNNIFPSLSVDENLHLSFWHGNGAYAARRTWVTTVFPMLKNRLDCRAGLLSGGERQALAIGMVLMRPVDLLLLDEPTAGLSPKAASDILEALHRAQQEAAFTSIMVEHNLRLVQPWITRVLVMNQGRIVADLDDPASLLDAEQLQRFYFG